MQSPAQLSYAYEVEPYSEAHWQKIEASTKLLGQLGHHVLFVPVLWHANCGSGPQMVVFHKEADTLVPDFSRLERYFRLVARECGPQRLLVLGVWGRWMQLGQRHPKAIELAETVYLTELKDDGSLAPIAWSSDYAAHEAMWAEVYAGVKALAARYLGVEGRQIVLGFADDVHPDPEIDAVWRRLAPESPGWDAWTHNYGEQGVRPVFFQIVDTAPPENVDALLDVSARREPLIENGVAVEPFYVSSCRDVQHARSPAALYYSVPDLAAAPQKTGRSIGLARIGLDFWSKTVPQVEGGESIADGFAGSRRRGGRAYPGRVVRNYRGYLTAQGPDGALPLIHFGALCEGVQAAQARWVIAREIARNPDQSEALRGVIELQFTKGARHGLIKDGGREVVEAVTVADLYAGWGPLFDAAATASGD